MAGNVTVELVQYANPSLRDIEEGVVSVETAPASKYALPTLSDVGVPTQPEYPEMDWGGQTFQVGPWDTGLGIPPEANQFLSGAGRGFANIGRAARQVTGNYSDEEARADQVMDKPLTDTGWGKAGEIATDFAVSSIIPVGGLSGLVGKGAAKVGASRLATGVGKSWLLDAGLNGAVQSQLRPTVNDESRLGNALWGAGSAMAGAAVLRPAFKALGKTINTVRNKWGDTSAQALNDMGIKYGVDLTPGDFAGHTGMRLTEDMSTGIPFTHRRQNMEREAGQIQDMLHSFREDVRPDLTVRDMQGAVLAQYQNADDMMVGELQRNFNKLTQQKDDLFENVGKVISNTPNAKPVTLTNTRREVDALLKAHPSVFSDFKGVDAGLEARMRGLDSNLSTATGVLNAQGQPFKRTARSSYDEAQWLRKQLGALSAQAQKQARDGGYNPDAAGKLQQVYKAVNKDLDTWGADPTNAAIHQSYKQAQNFYKANVVPFKKHPVLKKVVNEFTPYDPDVAAKEFFKPGRGNVAEQIMKFQTPEGRQASQFVIVDDMTERALNPDVDSGLDIKAFLRRAKQMEAAGEHVYTPAVLDRMNEVEQVARAGKRSVGYLDPAGNSARYALVKGAQLGGASIMGGGIASGSVPIAAASAGILGTAVGGLNTFNRMGGSQLGKRILMSDSTLPGGLQNFADLASTRLGEPFMYNLRHNGDLPEQIDSFKNDPRFFEPNPWEH